MKKALKNFLCLILLVASVFSFSSCIFPNVDMSLPKAVFDEDGNILYNGNVYLYNKYYSEVSLGGYYLKSPHQILRTTNDNGFAVPICGYGIEDYGEYVCIYVPNSYSDGGAYYFKEGFEFPDVWNLSIISLEFDPIEKNADSFVLENLFGEQSVSLNDFVDKTIVLPPEVYDFKNPSPDFKPICPIYIYFREHQTIYIRGYLYCYKSEPYLTIFGNFCKIKAEYVEIFENALNNLK